MTSRRRAGSWMAVRPGKSCAVPAACHVHARLAMTKGLAKYHLLIRFNIRLYCKFGRLSENLVKDLVTTMHVVVYI